MSYIFFLLVVSTVIGPTNLYGNVGQNAYFLWNTTGNNIIVTTWGLYDSSLQAAKPSFISVDFRTSVPEYSIDLDSTASRYKGRVEYIGSLSLGRAWFILKNLNVDDTNEYVAEIRESGSTGSLLRSE